MADVCISHSLPCMADIRSFSPIARCRRTGESIVSAIMALTCSLCSLSTSPVNERSPASLPACQPTQTACHQAGQPASLWSLGALHDATSGGPGARGCTLIPYLQCPRCHGERADGKRRPGFNPDGPGSGDLSNARQSLCGTLCSDGGCRLRPTESVTAVDQRAPPYAQQTRTPKYVHARLQEPARSDTNTWLQPLKITWIIWNP